MKVTATAPDTKVNRALRKTAKVILIAAIALFGVIFYFASKEPAKPVEAAETAPKTVSLGEMGIIRTGVPGAATEDDYDQIMKVFTSRDKEGLNQLIRAGRAVFVDNNTKIKVIDTGFSKRQVRLLSGDHKGAAVWVPVEFVEAE